MDVLENAGVSQSSTHADIIENLQKDGQVFSISSNLTFIPRPEDDRRYLVCLSQHETFPEKVIVIFIVLSKMML